jgi:hypothetical protein
LLCENSLDGSGIHERDHYTQVVVSRELSKDAIVSAVNGWVSAGPGQVAHWAESIWKAVESEKRRIEAWVALTLKWSAQVDLTSARSAEVLVGNHVQDALGYALLLKPASFVVDIGAGGGLPGILLGILRPDLRLGLVEPRHKRVAFLRMAVRELGIRQASVHLGRLEEDGSWPGIEALRGNSGSFQAISRATFPPVEWWVRGKTMFQALTREGFEVIEGRVGVLLGEQELPSLEEPLRSAEGRGEVLRYRAGTGSRRTIALLDCST